MDITQILLKNYPEAEWVLHGSTYEGLDWLDEKQTKPTEEELKFLWPSVENQIKIEQDAKANARTSALAKLAALGLTEEEIAAL
jgi:primosomal protein N'